MRVRRDFKDSLFCHLFGTEERKSNALELYNALAGACVDDPDDLELNTIGDAIFLGVKNDVSYLVSDEMLLWEHQSTYNPNMPLRGLHYFSRLYTKYVESHALDIYGAAKLRLPTPRFVVFFFGEADRPEREVLSFSDLCEAGPGDVQVTATVLNCNEGHNVAIMSACEALSGYAHLLFLGRKNRDDRGLGLEKAVRVAVDECIEEGVLADYLIEHRAEVEDMLFTIQDEERAMRVHEEAIAREARERGLAQGLEEGRARGLEQGLEQGRKDALLDSVKALMHSTGYDAATAVEMLVIPESCREEILSRIV